MKALLSGILIGSVVTAWAVYVRLPDLPPCVIRVAPSPVSVAVEPEPPPPHAICYTCNGVQVRWIGAANGNGQPR